MLILAAPHVNDSEGPEGVIYGDASYVDFTPGTLRLTITINNQGRYCDSNRRGATATSTVGLRPISESRFSDIDLTTYGNFDDLIITTPCQWAVAGLHVPVHVSPPYN
jgi:hypothetical protein